MEKSVKAHRGYLPQQGLLYEMFDQDFINYGRIGDKEQGVDLLPVLLQQSVYALGG